MKMKHRFYLSFYYQGLFLAPHRHVLVMEKRLLTEKISSRFSSMTLTLVLGEESELYQGNSPLGVGDVYHPRREMVIH